MSLLLTALLLLPSAPAPARDILLPGNRPVTHELSLEIDEGFAEWRFLASPVAGFRGVTVIESGVPFRFSSKYGTRIYAVPLADEVPERCSTEWAEGRPVTLPGVGEINQISVSSPLARVLTKLRVVEVQGAEIRLEEIGEQRFDASGRLIDETMLRVFLIGMAGVGVLGLFLLHRCRSA
jgi:hypothetical protein